MKILLLHHVEARWQKGYERYGTDFYEYADNIRNFIEHSDFDRIILVRFEDPELGDEHYVSGLANYIDHVEVYGYGWWRSQMEEQYPDGEGTIWADGCWHSEVVLLDDWLKGLRGHQLTIVGAFAGECVLTLTTALDHLGVSYKEEHSLIVGSGVPYVPREPELELAIA